MKRAAALRPLSREHLAALLVAKALREADDEHAAAGAFLEFWEREGKHHFRVEEEVLLPGWALHAEVDRAGVSRMLDEHLRIRREALRLEDGKLGLEEIHALGQLLHDHVRFEERTLFPLVEEALSEEAMRRLAERIERSEAEGSQPV
ncbi:MAG TPA: hemerythrin domain-containing protein [Solirubrobacterales bacterium]|nr:hemerythrin domain-containing protein [Solirubrobacterales bacterium]